MVGVTALIQGACAAIVMALAIGIYQKKPRPAAMEQRLASLPLVVHATILVLLVLLFASSMGWVSGKLSLPEYFVDKIGLLIHEAGHFFTAWAGRFVHFFGGTLLEVGVPATLAIWFIMAGHHRFGAIILSWLHIALISVARYAADAQDLRLNLLGASDLIEDKMAGHDWHNMLSMLNLLEATPLIADMIWSVGVVAGIVSVVLFSWTIHAAREAERVLHQKLS